MDKNLITKTKKTNLVKVNKDDKLVIRIGTELKEQFTKYVENKGATVSDYVRQMIMEKIHEKSTQEHIVSTKDFLNEIHNPELSLLREIRALQEQMIALEYRLNEKLNENKK